jgi:hypothetical protein
MNDELQALAARAAELAEDIRSLISTNPSDHVLDIHETIHPMLAFNLAGMAGVVIGVANQLTDLAEGDRYV